MNFFHSIIVKITFSVSSILVSVGILPAPVQESPPISPVPSTTKAVTTAPQPISAPTEAITMPAVITTEVTRAVAQEPTPQVIPVPIQLTPIPAPVPAVTPPPIQALPPITVEVHVEQPPTAPLPAPESTYSITPPEDAPARALELLGSRLKTLPEIREWVVSLVQHVAVKKKMQNASIETLTQYLAGNGYRVEPR